MGLFMTSIRILSIHGYEGLVAKDLSAPYVEARSTKWLKVERLHGERFPSIRQAKDAVLVWAAMV
jgi:ATP-dependent DNA ligase